MASRHVVVTATSNANKGHWPWSQAQRTPMRELPPIQKTSGNRHPDESDQLSHLSSQRVFVSAMLDPHIIEHH